MSRPVGTSATPKQKKVLDFVRCYLDEKGFPPTRQEIANALGYKSPNAAQEVLDRLERLGRVALTRGITRGIKLIAEKPEGK
jgi:repressor LexA